MGVSDDVSGVDEDSGSRAAARLQPVRRTLTNGNVERMDPNDGGRDALHQVPDAVAESAQGIGLRSRLVRKSQTKEQADPYHDATSVHVKIVTRPRAFRLIDQVSEYERAHITPSYYHATGELRQEGRRTAGTV